MQSPIQDETNNESDGAESEGAASVKRLHSTDKMDLSVPFKGFGTVNSAMLEYEKASRVRSHLHLKMKRLEDVLSKSDLDIFQLKECADRLAAVQSEYEAVHMKILEVSDVLDEEEEIYADFEVNFYALFRSVKQRIAVATAKEVVPSVSKQTSRVKLPEIKLPKFDGSLSNWTTFRDNFKMLIDAALELSEIDKFTYLISCLTDEAKRVIEVIDVTAANYSVAWELLSTRFENKYLIVKSHVDAIFSITPVRKECPESIMQLIDAFERNLKMLEKLGEQPKGWSTLLVFRLASCLDPATLRQWETHKRSTEVPTYNELVKFLRDHCQVLQSIESVKSNPTEKIQSQVRRKLNLKNTEAYSTVSLGAERCVFCGEQRHSPYKCATFRNMAVSDRRDLVKNKKLCFNCLGANHVVKDCPSGACRVCRKKHHTMLHETSSAVPVYEPVQQLPEQEMHPGPSTQASSNPQPTASLNHCFVNVPPTSSQVSSTVLLQTAVVKVGDCNGTQYWARALLDSASQLNIVTERLAQRLRLPRKKEMHSIGGIGELKIVSHSTVTISLQSKCSSFKTASKFHVLSQVTRNLPVSTVDLTQITIPENIQLADANFHEPGPIDMIIGMELYYLILEEGLLKLNSGSLAVQKTVLGWVVAGKATVIQPTGQTFLVAHACSDIDTQLQKFWELEACRTNSTLSIEESQCERYFCETTKRTQEGRFVVCLPKRYDKISQLGESKSIATRRFLALERRLQTRPLLKQQYTQFITEYLDLGHMTEIVEETTANPSYYMPHHCVLRPDKLTTKLRVVFDASCPSSSGVSLNDGLMVGPVLQDDLMSILLRFRMPKYVLIADIEKMYRQILVANEDHPLQRILWRDSPTEKIRTFELRTVTYGSSCAPYLATKALQALSKSEADTYPKAARVLSQDFYMDDMLTGVNTVEEGQHLSKQLLNLLQSAGFCLRKWTSNSLDMLSNIPSDLRDNRTVYDLDSPASCIKTLGLKWQPTTDTFLFDTPAYTETHISITKRTAVSDSAKLFDPLGLVGPVVVTAKIFLQQLWQNELSWDEPLKPELQKQWLDFRENLVQLHNISIPRYVLSDPCAKQIQLHGFCDASEKAYGACIYIRTVSSDDTVTVNLLTAKSKVAPLATSRKQKRICLPRLELSAALLMAHLYEKVASALQSHIESFFWSDSSIVLHWLAANPSRWKVFVANRVSEIQHLTENGTWNHVPGTENPADIISRGMNPAQLQHSKLWWNGPKWLNEQPMIWPSNPTINPELPKEHLEERVALMTHDVEPNSIFLLRSSFGKLTRLVAWMLGFIHNSKPKNREKRRFTHLTTQELNDSTKCLVRLAQLETFSEEFRSLRKNGFVSTHSKLKALNPYIEDNLLRVGGRLRNAEVSNDRRHPLILPSNHPLTSMIAMQVHLQMLHASPQLLTASLRERFWPLRIRNLARKTVHSCLRCFRCRPTQLEQIMGDLPTERVSPALPFVRTGVDLCGPVAYRYPHRKSQPLKGYVVIFVCMVVKAVHIEFVTDLTTDAFLSSLRRFIARRGKPSLIECDNAKNFVGASKELAVLAQQFKDQTWQNTIIRGCSDEGIEFKFIPPRSPNFGGLWEAAVKSFKNHLRPTMGNALLTYDQLITLLAQIEGCMNSRPLTQLSTDPADLDVLTPGHFLIHRPLSALAEPSLEAVPANKLNQWQEVQEYVRRLWKRWSTEYLSGLQPRAKWNRQRNNITVGTMVLVKTKDGTYKRAISKICILPIQENNSNL